MIRARYAILMAALLSSPALAQTITTPSGQDSMAAPAPGEGAPMTDQNARAVQSGQPWSPGGSPTDPRGPTTSTGGPSAPTDQATTGSTGGQTGTSDNGMNSTGTMGQGATTGTMGTTDSSMGTDSSTGSSGTMGSGSTSGTTGATGTSSGGMAQMAAADPQDYPRCSARRRDRCQQTASQEARATDTPRRRR